MSNIIPWLFLSCSIVLEVAGTVIMKASQAAWPVPGMAAMYLLLGLSYWCLARAVTRVPVGVAYAVWEGAGLALITLAGSLMGERLTPSRMAALAAIFCGVLMVHHGTRHDAPKPARDGVTDPSGRPAQADREVTP
ncbi:DMT family transporter [Nitratidesulfovibrio sp. SRB-5]|uniref:DMT family transporter n=1 Tax=Nitratidesulfovibrio sp. SRB-5 TaxID=2872636 RepID=UPI001027087D|nr:multidrug efflux SMR transporter [Nitratidesulfovibrio sp. SRB-5]MBZ2173322.1 multidrug efflux SMR transporter [Nitratidesulfovibrio sp. SRB-5]RXF76741.1 multidrug efflux SMR transporter [Desulfovibrio sp. DS-1]